MMPRARWIGWAAVALVAAAASAAQAEPQRVEAHGPAFHAAGTLFERHGHYLAFDDEGRRAFLGTGGADPAFADREAKRVASMPGDRLAESYVDTYRRLRAMELRMAWMRQLIEDDAALDAALRSATVKVERPAGGSDNMPLTVAIAQDVVSLSLMAARLSSTPHPTVAGRYRIATQGDGCPIAPGPVEVVRRDALIEARRDDTAVLAGVVGPGRTAVVTAEQLYGTVDEDAARGPRLDLPASPQTVYAAPSGERMDLEAGPRAACTITLAPAG